MLLASAATAAAIALAGCDTDSLTKSSLRAKQPLSDKMLAEIAKKDMLKETPILIRIFRKRRSWRCGSRRVKAATRC
jgi:murein L,D-transpeptidase YafK